MTPRELVVKTLNHESVPRVPRDLWGSPGGVSPSADELAEINVRYPNDIVTPEATRRPHGKKTRGKHNGSTDAWGCVWKIDQAGVPTELEHSPLSSADKIASYQPPAKLLDRSRFTKANKTCQSTNRFVLAWSEVCPFNRLRLLRGNEAALADLAQNARETRSLLAMLHDFACKELERWAETEVDGVVFRDDWGTPEGLLVTPETWRGVFRPLYLEYCKILHAKDKFVFFRSDGDIQDIFGDLVKIGIDAIHSQLHLMNLARLVKRYRGRVTFWGEIDRQQFHGLSGPEEFRESVLSIRKALDQGDGGVIAQCQWEPGVRIETIVAFFEQWLVPLPARANIAP